MDYLEELSLEIQTKEAEERAAKEREHDEAAARQLGVGGEPVADPGDTVSDAMAALDVGDGASRQPLDVDGSVALPPPPQAPLSSEAMSAARAMDHGIAIRT